MFQIKDGDLIADTRVTVAVTSYNRGKYLDALLRSLKNECITGCHQVIVVDNCSTESRVYDAIDNQRDWIDDVTYRTEQDWINDEYIAKNLIISKAAHEIILFLQDDLQFIGPPGSISRYASALAISPFLCMTVNGVRLSTLQNTLVRDPFASNNVKLWQHRDRHFHTMGFFKAQTFRDVGPYPTHWPQQKEFWGRSEDSYDSLVKQRYPQSPISATAHVPLFLPVWNDPRGGYAFIRDNKRYGHYIDARDDSGLYYAKLTQAEFDAYSAFEDPVPYIDVAKPLGWTVTRGPDGDQFKYPQRDILVEGPVAEIDA